MMNRILHPASRIPLLTFLFALGIYLLTLPPDLTWAHDGGDGGELIAAAVTLGVPHPSGYPTYVLLGKLVSFLPLGTVAMRFNLFSAVCMALAASFVTAIGQGKRFGLGETAALGAGLLFAWLPLVWSQALIAEVYGLQMVLVAAFLWALLDADLAEKRPFLAPVLLGLAITAHLTSAALLPLLLLHTSVKRWLWLLPPFALGLTPFLAVPLLARGESVVIWGNPTSLASWWAHISGQLYRSNVFAASWEGVWEKLVLWFGWRDWLFILVSLGMFWIGRKWEHASESVTINYGMPITAVFYLFYALFYTAPDAYVFALPALLLLNVALMPLLKPLKWRTLWLPLLLVLLNFGQLQVEESLLARPMATKIWQQTPPNSLLITPGDQTIFALYYFQQVESMRKDVILVDSNLFAFDWYRNQISARHPQLNALEIDDIDTFTAANSQSFPLCRVSLRSLKIAAPAIRCG